MLDLIIKNGHVFDGTGAEPVDLDIGIKKGEIAEVGKLRAKLAHKIIDARGKCVSPGFIDAQNHSDSYWTIFDYPHQQSLLAQGITTVAFGNCGASLAPLPSLESLKSVQKWHSLEGVNFSWQYFEEYLDVLAKQPLGVNVASLVGHSTIRRGLIADEMRKVSVQEIKIMERLLSASLKNGGAGLSLGLSYAHEYLASAEELRLLVRVVKTYNRLLSVHLRSEGTHILEALDETIHLAESNEIRLKVSHLKIRGQKNWPLFDQMLTRLERAFQKGLEIYFDVYPYDVSWNVLYTYLPKWSFEGGRRELVKRLKQPYLRKKILDNLRGQDVALSNIILATSSSSPHLVGRSLAEIAESQGVSVEEAVLNVLSSAESEVVVFDRNISEEQMLELLKHPLSIISTDGAGFDLNAGLTSKNLIHPRCFGATARFLELAIRNNILPLSAAIHKLTGRPAKALQLPRRGIIKKRAVADLVVFDPDKISDQTSLNNPFQTPRGISEVLVNGAVTLEDGKFTGDYNGEVIRF